LASLSGLGAGTPGSTPAKAKEDPSSGALAQAVAPAADSIWSRLSFYGDGRLRAESTFDQPNGEDRHRGRMRLRVGAVYHWTEELRAEARISTAAPGADANNPHWDFGDGADGFEGANLVLDRFFLAWKPHEDWTLRGGKFPHAFASPPVFGEFLWDADVQPAGLAAIWAPGDKVFDLRAVEYVAVENGGDSDPAMFGLQGNVTARVTERLSLQLSSCYSHWSSLGAGAGVLANQGNTDVAGDFSILEGFVAATWDGGPLERTTGFVQSMHNVADDDDEEVGYALGLQFGKSGKRGDANVFGVRYDLDANAVYSPVAQDDTPIGGTGIGTGMEGWILGGQYFLTDELSFKLWVLSSDADAADDPFRLRFDVDFKFR
jgi:hypothetical protein